MANMHEGKKVRRVMKKKTPANTSGSGNSGWESSENLDATSVLHPADVHAAAADNAPTTVFPLMRLRCSLIIRTRLRRFLIIRIRLRFSPIIRTLPRCSPPTKRLPMPLHRVMTVRKS